MEVMQRSVLANVFINNRGKWVCCGMVTFRVTSRSAECEELQKDLSGWVRNQHEIHYREIKYKVSHKGIYHLSFPHKIMVPE